MLYSTAKKYNLLGHVHNMLDTVTAIPKLTWKRLVTNSVHHRYKARWQMTCAMYPKLHVYREVVSSITVSMWWHVCRHSPAMTKNCKLLMTLIAGEHRLRTGRGRHVASTLNCQNCDMHTPETLRHVLCQCPNPVLVAVRDREWHNLTVMMPPPMIQDIVMMPDQQKMVLLLSGLGGGYVSEWQGVYVGIATLITTLYRTHISLWSAEQRAAQVPE